MHTLTLIRLNSITRVFEDSGICLLGDIEKQLQKHSASFEDVEKALNMRKGDRLTITIDNNEKIWFYYINRIS